LLAAHDKIGVVFRHDESSICQPTIGLVFFVKTAAYVGIECFVLLSDRVSLEDGAQAQAVVETADAYVVDTGMVVVEYYFSFSARSGELKPGSKKKKHRTSFSLITFAYPFPLRPR